MADHLISSPARAALLLTAALALSACSTAMLLPEPSPPPPPAPILHSVAEADSALAKATRDRAAIEAEFLAEERVCYDKFFVNRCLDGVKEKHRAGLAAVRVVEVAANYYKRKSEADERDRQMAIDQKNAADEAMRRAAEEPKEPHVVGQAPAPPHAAVDREAEHASRLHQREAQEQAKAPERAAKAVEFEKRKADSEQRQRDIAAKKAEKARKAEAKAAASASAAASAAASSAASKAGAASGASAASASAAASQAAGRAASRASASAAASSAASKQ